MKKKIPIMCMAFLLAVSLAPAQVEVCIEIAIVYDT